MLQRAVAGWAKSSCEFDVVVSELPFGVSISILDSDVSLGRKVVLLVGLDSYKIEHPTVIYQGSPFLKQRIAVQVCWLPG